VVLSRGPLAATLFGGHFGEWSHPTRVKADAKGPPPRILSQPEDPLGWTPPMTAAMPSQIHQPEGIPRLYPIKVA
jgi:hypothetical protein